jgi:cysteine desulfurase family protein
VADPSSLVWTANATHALNQALHGLLRPGDHVVTTSLEHNSVMRPLRALEARGVGVTVVPGTSAGTIDLLALREACAAPTRLLVTTHASNVTGAITPVADVADIAHGAGALYLLDAAQTAGTVPLDVDRLGLDLVAMTGHKGLMGPTGTGALYVRPGLDLDPIMHGGTGSDSAHEHHPAFMPDHLEAGTVNVAGLAGLGAALAFLADIGVEAVRAHDQQLVARFLDGVANIRAVRCVGPAAEARCGLVACALAGADASEVALVLERDFGILARAGLHCAPSAHRTVATFPAGLVRFSFGWFNTTDDVDACVDALRRIASWTA